MEQLKLRIEALEWEEKALANGKSASYTRKYGTEVESYRQINQTFLND